MVRFLCARHPCPLVVKTPCAQYAGLHFLWHPVADVYERSCHVRKRVPRALNSRHNTQRCRLFATVFGLAGKRNLRNRVLSFVAQVHPWATQTLHATTVRCLYAGSAATRVINGDKGNDSHVLFFFGRGRSSQARCVALDRSWGAKATRVAHSPRGGSMVSVFSMPTVGSDPGFPSLFPPPEKLRGPTITCCPRVR